MAGADYVLTVALKEPQQLTISNLKAKEEIHLDLILYQPVLSATTQKEARLG
jgi:hypothetical protein